MTEEVKTQEQPKNTVATVGMRFSIIGLIALVTVFFVWLGLPLLFIGFILGIIGLFFKPRGKARVAVCIPLIIFIILGYLVSSIKTPAKDFIGWVESKQEVIKDLDEGKFEYILKSELNNVINEKSEDEWKTMYENSTGTNAIEKGSYLFFSLFQQAFENSLEIYNSGELPEINNEDNIVDIDTDTNNEEDDNENQSEENDNEDQPEEESENETLEVSPETGETDIEQIIDTLE